MRASREKGSSAVAHILIVVVAPIGIVSTFLLWHVFFYAPKPVVFECFW